MTPAELDQLMDDVMNDPHTPSALKVRMYKLHKEHAALSSRANMLYTALVVHINNTPEKKLTWSKGDIEAVENMVKTGKTPVLNYREEGDGGSPCGALCHLELGELVEFEDAPPEVQAVVGGMMKGGAL